MKESVYVLVGAVDILNGENGKVAVVARVAQGDAGTSLETKVVNLLLVDVEGDGHAKEHAASKTVVLDDTLSGLLAIKVKQKRAQKNSPVVVLLGHEAYAMMSAGHSKTLRCKLTLEGREAAIEN